MISLFRNHAEPCRLVLLLCNSRALFHHPFSLCVFMLLVRRLSMPVFPKFGNQTIPFAEPSWYRGNPTPYYQQKHVNVSQSVIERLFVHGVPCLSGCVWSGVGRMASICCVVIALFLFQ